MGAHTHLTTEGLSLFGENVALKDFFSGNHVRSGSGGALDVAAARVVSNVIHQTGANFGNGADIDFVEGGDPLRELMCRRLIPPFSIINLNRIRGCNHSCWIRESVSLRQHR